MSVSTESPIVATKPKDTVLPPKGTGKKGGRKGKGKKGKVANPAYTRNYGGLRCHSLDNGFTLQNAAHNESAASICNQGICKHAKVGVPFTAKDAFGWQGQGGRSKGTVPAHLASLVGKGFLTLGKVRGQFLVVGNAKGSAKKGSRKGSRKPVAAVTVPTAPEAIVGTDRHTTL